MEGQSDLEGQSDRRLAAVMFCDMVGFTAAMQEDEPSAPTQRARYRTVVEDLHNEFGGEIVQYYGDGTLSIFTNSVDAVRCAVSIQQTFSEVPVVPVRVGVHVGDVVVEDHGLLGDAGNAASRVESANPAVLCLNHQGASNGAAFGRHLHQLPA